MSDFDRHKRSQIIVMLCTLVAMLHLFVRISVNYIIRISPYSINRIVTN